MGEEASFYLLSYGRLFSYKTRGRNPASERVTVRRTGNGRAVDAIHRKTRAYELKTESAMQRPSRVCVCRVTAVCRFNILIQDRPFLQVTILLL